MLSLRTSALSLLVAAVSVDVSYAFAPSTSLLCQGAQRPQACFTPLRMAAESEGLSLQQRFGSGVAALVIAGGLLTPFAASAGPNFQMPPIDRTDPNRCQFKSSAMGQSNAARDKLYDLRECPMSGLDAKGFDLAGAVMVNGDFSKVNFKEATMSKVNAANANFDGADFSNAILDRGTWRKSSFKGAVFANAVLSGSDFAGADLTDTDFSDAYMGDFDNKNLCKNPTLTGTNPKTGYGYNLAT